MSFAAGTRLGPCEILSAIGAGGMGEVYRARDTQLKRDVALKALPAGPALEKPRLTRFPADADVPARILAPGPGRSGRPAGNGQLVVPDSRREASWNAA